VLSAHTAAHRAAELEAFARQALDAAARCAAVQPLRRAAPAVRDERRAVPAPGRPI
jgi:hypothetical protein